MATITKRVCDRCGQEIKYKGWTSVIKNIFKRGSEIVIDEIYDGNPSGYDCENLKYELCAECTEKLKKFLREGEKDE